MAKKLFYKIGEACKKVDVQPYVLRYWETEFDLLSPDKSKSGQRVYTNDDLAIIRRIKELLYDEGYTTVGAKKKLQAELDEGKLGSTADSSSKAAPKSGTAKSGKAKAGSSKDSPEKNSSAKDDTSKSAKPAKPKKEPETKAPEPPDKSSAKAESDAAAAKKPDSATNSDAASDAASSTVADRDPKAKQAEVSADSSDVTKPVDSGRVEELESGLKSALAQARSILDLLG